MKTFIAIISLTIWSASFGYFLPTIIYAFDFGIGNLSGFLFIFSLIFSLVILFFGLAQSSNKLAILAFLFFIGSSFVFHNHSYTVPISPEEYSNLALELRSNPKTMHSIKSIENIEIINRGKYLYLMNSCRKESNNRKNQDMKLGAIQEISEYFHSIQEREGE